MSNLPFKPRSHDFIIPMKFKIVEAVIASKRGTIAYRDHNNNVAIAHWGHDDTSTIVGELEWAKYVFLSLKSK